MDITSRVVIFWVPKFISLEFTLKLVHRLLLSIVLVVFFALLPRFFFLCFFLASFISYYTLDIAILPHVVVFTTEVFTWFTIIVTFFMFFFVALLCLILSLGLRIILIGGARLISHSAMTSRGGARAQLDISIVMAGRFLLLVRGTFRLRRGTGEGRRLLIEVNSCITCHLIDRINILVSSTFVIATHLTTSRFVSSRLLISTSFFIPERLLSLLLTSFFLLKLA